MGQVQDLMSVGFSPRQAQILGINICPTGVILPFGGSSAPSGFLLCDGTAVSRTTYADLFTAIGTSYGTGDGSTTFNLPDVRQRFPLGKAAAGTGSSLGASGGAIDHTHSTPAHSHTVAAHTHSVPAHYHSSLQASESSTASGSSGNHIVSNNTGGSRTFAGSSIGNTGGVDGDAAMTSGSASPATDSSGSGTSGANNPPYLVMNFIIKY
jgi:microcystin-dependent protein